MKQISQPSLTASWFQNFLLLFWVWLVRKVSIAIYNRNISLTSVFTHAFWLMNFVQNVSIRLKIKVMSGKSVSTWWKVIWKSTWTKTFMTFMLQHSCRTSFFRQDCQVKWLIHLSCKLECQLKTDVVDQLYVTILKFYTKFEPFVRICHILIEIIEPLPFDTSI